SSDADVAMKIEASCLLRMSGSIILGMKGAVGIRLATANNAVARRLLGILKKQYELPTNVLVRQGLNLRKKNMYTLSVEPSIEGRQALEDLALWPVTEFCCHRCHRYSITRYSKSLQRCKSSSLHLTHFLLGCMF
ncbi:hypothetical protein NE583_09655, partial [Veillonella parvula]|nr:hypothetical protein [Veillonella parvula]